MTTAVKTDPAGLEPDDSVTVFRAFERGEFLEWPAWTRLRRILCSNGGSYGLSGPRGAGKSWLMLRAIAWIEGGEGSEGKRAPGIGLWYPSPSEYDPHAFIASLTDSFAGQIERWYAKSQPVRRKTTNFRLALVLSVVGLALGLIAVARNFTYDFWDGFLLLAAEIGIGLIVLIPLFWWRSRWPERRLLLRARRASERARYSTTQRESTEYGGQGGAHGVLAQMRRARERELVERPATLSSLVNEFRAVAAEAGEVTGGVIIAIDELDKMSDPEKVRGLLRDIKAIFEVPNVHFLVSVSDEAARTLSLGALTKRDEFNSSFYTVLQAQPARPEDCAELLERRGNVPREVSLVLAVLAGGNPREVVRLAELAGPVATGREAAMVALGEEGLALRREVVTAEHDETMPDLGDAAREAAFVTLTDEAFERAQEFKALCERALTADMWAPGWADDGWRWRFAESWRRLMVRLAVAGELAESRTLVRDTEVTDRLLDVIVAAGQSGHVARIMLERNLRIESRRSTPDAPDEHEVRDQLVKAARNYEQTRASMSSGPERTRALEKIAHDARRLAREAHYTSDDIRKMLRSTRAGDRLVGLATVQSTADPATFDDVLGAVRSAQTAFEQYHALRALESLRPGLSEAARAQVAGLLEDDAWRAEARLDDDRLHLVERILRSLRSEAVPQTKTA